MQYSVIAVVIPFLLLSCNKSAENVGLSRIEQLKEVPYRGETIKVEITQQINKNIQLILERTKSLNDVKIFYVSKEGELKQIDGIWKTGSEALKEADELWRDIDLIMTIVIYPSYSQNATTGKISDLWAIEVEHKNVTRTCRMFFDTPTPTEITELNC